MKPTELESSPTGAEITLNELEESINYWRSLRPSIGEERALSPEVDTLATIYALMIFNGLKSVPDTMLDQASLQLLDACRQRRI